MLVHLLQQGKNSFKIYKYEENILYMFDMQCDFGFLFYNIGNFNVFY